MIRKVHIDGDGNVTEVNPIDKEIQTLMNSNLVQLLLSVGFDASLIKSTCEKQVSKSGQPPFLDLLDLYSLALSALDTDTLEHLLSFIDDTESLSLEQFTSEISKYLRPDSTVRKKNEKIIKLVNFMNRHCLKWTNKVVQSKDSNIAFKPLWLDIETHDSFLAYAEANFNSRDYSKDVTLIFWENIEPEVENLCKNFGWNCSPAALITEEIISVVIIYDHEDFHLDTFVRARDKLIIVTKSMKM